MKTQFESAGARVLAINPASVKAHQSYSAKMGYSFPILSDPGGRIVAAYKCQPETGKGVIRTVYGLDRTGTIIFAERGQADLNEVLAAIRSLA